MKNAEIDDLKSNGYFVAVIDGAKCSTLKSAIEVIALAFQFPDYYGKNLDAFWECINDLEWLHELHYALIVENSERFMSYDSKENKLYLLNLLSDVCKEWAGVPNLENDGEFRRRADFKVIYI